MINRAAPTGDPGLVNHLPAVFLINSRSEQVVMVGYHDQQIGWIGRYKIIDSLFHIRIYHGMEIMPDRLSARSAAILPATSEPPSAISFSAHANTRTSALKCVAIVSSIWCGWAPAFSVKSQAKQMYLI